MKRCSSTGRSGHGQAQPHGLPRHLRHSSLLRCCGSGRCWTACLTADLAGGQAERPGASSSCQQAAPCESICVCFALPCRTLPCPCPAGHRHSPRGRAAACGVPLQRCSLLPEEGNVAVGGGAVHSSPQHKRHIPQGGDSPRVHSLGVKARVGPACLRWTTTQLISSPPWHPASPMGAGCMRLSLFVRPVFLCVCGIQARAACCRLTRTLNDPHTEHGTMPLLSCRLPSCC